MQDCFRKSFLFYCPIVFKRKLLPLSLGHIVFLDLIASPFFSNKEKSFSDYINLAYFCSLSFADCMQKLNDFQKTLKEIEVWGKEQNILDKNQFLSEIETLNEYWKYYNDFPKRYSTDNDKDNRLKVPVHFYIYWILKDRFNEQEIFDMPITKAISLITVHQNINGDKSIMSEQDEMQLEDFKNKIESGEIDDPVLNKEIL